MPYKCVHCSEAYEDASPEVMNGCSSCGGKFFFYVKAEKLRQIVEEKQQELSPEEKQQIEQDVREIAGVEDEQPVFLDVESIRVLKPGKYLLDLDKLFDRAKPRVYQLEDGKYIVDLSGKPSI